jgi:hypothetical protein
MIMKRSSVVAVSIALVCMGMAVILSNCGGGGGGGGQQLSPPAFTNLAGTRWNTTDTVSQTNSCGVGIGVSDTRVEHVLAQSGNTISIYDERSGSSAATNQTLSGYVLTVSGPRFPIGGCSSMTESASVTLNNAGTSFSGSGTIKCLDDGCTVPVTIVGTKI